MRPLEPVMLGRPAASGRASAAGAAPLLQAASSSAPRARVKHAGFKAGPSVSMPGAFMTCGVAQDDLAAAAEFPADVRHSRVGSDEQPGLLPEHFRRPAAFPCQFILVPADDHPGLREAPALGQRIVAVIVQDGFLELLHHFGGLVRRLDFGLPRSQAGIDDPGERLELVQRPGQFGVCPLLFCQVAEGLVAEGHIALDAPANVPDEDHQLLERSLDFGPALFLFVAAVNWVQGVPDRAGSPALVMGLLAFHVQHVLARSDAQGVSQDIDHSERA